MEKKSGKKKKSSRLLVEDAVEAVPLALDEVQDGLVVLEHQVRYHYALRGIGCDLALEHVLVEVIVQLLVTVVDAQLSWLGHWRT